MVKANSAGNIASKGVSTVNSSSARCLMVLGLIVVLAGLFAGCGNTEFNSAWRDREITMDGKDVDWSNIKVYAIDEPKVSLGLLNDESSLFLLFETNDRSLLPRLMRGGLTVWFDPSGKKDKAFGVHFPIGRQETGMAEMPRGGFQGERNADTSGRAPEELSKRMEEAFQSLELIGPAKGQRCTLTVADAEAKGVKAGITFSAGELIYELQLPLRIDAQHPYALALPGSGIAAKQKISLGFETGRFEGPKERGLPEGGEGGAAPGGGMGRWGGGSGGMGRRGGGMGGGGGGFGGGAGRRQGGGPTTQGLDLWATLKLASKK